MLLSKLTDLARKLSIQVTLLLIFMPQVKAAEGDIYVNRKLLTSDQMTQARAFFKSVLVPGRYWYDSLSGLWGFEGGPNAGQIQPGLPFLPAALPTDISGGKTNVFVNGRELHLQEYQILVALFGSVIPGRYWMNHQGIGGPEGQAPTFNLATMGKKQSSSGWFHGSHSARGGSVVGGVVGFIGTDGTGITCGPDGGCF